MPFFFLLYLHTAYVRTYSKHGCINLNDFHSDSECVPYVYAKKMQKRSSKTRFSGFFFPAAAFYIRYMHSICYIVDLQIYINTSNTYCLNVYLSLLSIFFSTRSSRSDHTCFCDCVCVSSDPSKKKKRNSKVHKTSFFLKDIIAP